MTRPTIRPPRRFRAPVRQYFGKYRAKVENNEDPLMLGRVQARVAIKPQGMLNWCMPCTPYAGPGVGFYAIPPIGANIWVEFEGGDLNYPIWAGCFWGEGEVPIVTPEPPNPFIKTLKTEFAKIVLDDTPEIGGVLIQCGPPAVDGLLSIRFNSLGITISAPPATIQMIMEEGITLTYPPDVIAMTEEAIEIAVPASSITLVPETTTVTAPNINVLAEGGVTVGAADAVVATEASLTLSAGMEASFSAGASAEITAGGEMTIAAALVMIN